VRNATTLMNELALCARFGHGIVLVLPEVEFVGEQGQAVGANGPDLNVWFSTEQALRMYERLLEGSSGSTAD
jgi:hypothetical protein